MLASRENRLTLFDSVCATCGGEDIVATADREREFAISLLKTSLPASKRKIPCPQCNGNGKSENRGSL